MRIKLKDQVPSRSGDQLTNQWDLVGTETTGWPVLPGKKVLARTCGQRHLAANEAGRRAA